MNKKAKPAKKKGTIKNLKARATVRVKDGDVKGGGGLAGGVVQGGSRVI